MNLDDFSYELTTNIMSSPTIPMSPVYTITSGINGSSALDWSSASITTSTNSSKTLEVKGDAHFDGDIKVQGKSLVEAIENIEKRLAILHPNPELEEKWDQLKSLGDMYRELEAEILEKEKVWKILKK